MAVVWIVLVTVLIALTNGEVCPEGQQSCATGMTCCLLPSGGQGCCPYANATCCTDRVHCCPHGSTCVPGVGAHCSSAPELLSAFTKAHIIKHKNKKKLVQPVLITVMNQHCLDGQQCPDNNTCCLMAGGDYGCCPLPTAVCCADKLHCCPSGSVCDKGGYCKQSLGGNEVGNPFLHRFEKLAASSRDNIIKCADGQTVCEVDGQQYGCCALPDAVCCSDKKHCCPNGYSCASGACVKNKKVFLP